MHNIYPDILLNIYSLNTTSYKTEPELIKMRSFGA